MLWEVREEVREGGKVSWLYFLLAVSAHMGWKQCAKVELQGDRHAKSFICAKVKGFASHLPVPAIRTAHAS